MHMVTGLIIQSTHHQLPDLIQNHKGQQLWRDLWRVWVSYSGNHRFMLQPAQGFLPSDWGFWLYNQNTCCTALVYCAATRGTLSSAIFFRGARWQLAPAVLQLVNPAKASIPIFQSFFRN